MDSIQCNALTKVYGSVKALDDLTFRIEENTITGLIGRNGAGKTTLLKIIAGFLRPTYGDITVFTENPFDNLKVSSNLILVDDQMPLPGFLSLADLMEAASSFYENWDWEIARGLFEYFSFKPDQLYKTLSKGKKSTFNMILGIAAHCPLTIFDEPTTGMDAAVRKDFYRALLKDYIAYPRTIILSSHLLNEVEDILEDVLLIHNGHKHLHLPVTDLKEYAVGLRGKSTIVNEFARGKEILFEENVGKDSSYLVVRNDFSEADLQQMKLKGVELSGVATDDLCVYLTSNRKGGINDVFKGR